MEKTGIHEISFDLYVGDGGFPFEFTRQAGAGPAGERIRFIMADVANRRIEVEWFKAAEREFEPIAIAPPPIPR